MWYFVNSFCILHDLFVIVECVFAGGGGGGGIGGEGGGGG